VDVIEQVKDVIKSYGLWKTVDLLFENQPNLEEGVEDMIN